MLILLLCRPELTYYTCTIRQAILMNCTLDLKDVQGGFMCYFRPPQKLMFHNAGALPLKLLVSWMISPLSLSHHANSLPWELLLKSGAMDAISHVLKISPLYICVFCSLESLKVCRIAYYPFSSSRDTHFCSVEVLMSFWHSLGWCRRRGY